jgi:hypothetical protein
VSASSIVSSRFAGVRRLSLAFLQPRPRIRRSRFRSWSIECCEGRLLPSSASPAAIDTTAASSAETDRPGYLQWVDESDFGTSIIRITDQTEMGVDLTGRRFLRNSYSKVQPWNADESLLLIGYSWGGVVLDGQTYEFIRTIWHPYQSRWSNTDPDILYGVYQNSLVMQDLSNIRDPGSPNPVYQTLRQFSQFDSISIGEGEGSLSLDDKWVALQCKKGDQTFLVVYNLKTDRMVQLNLNGQWPDNVTMSPSGRKVIVQWQESGTLRGQGIETYSVSGNRLLFSRKLTPYATHFDVGFDVARKEVIVFRDPVKWENGIVKVNIDTGKLAKVYWGTGYNQPSWSGSHVSFQNSKRPGWVYWSDYAPEDQSDRAGYRMIYALKLDGSRTVEAFAHSRPGEDVNVYGTQPMAVPSRDGSRVLWGTTWNGASGDPVLTYVAARNRPA